MGKIDQTRYSAPLETSGDADDVQVPVLPEDTQAQFVLIQFLETVIQAGPPSANPTSAREAVGFISQRHQASFSLDDTELFPQLLSFMQIASVQEISFSLDAFEVIGDTQMSGIVTVNLPPNTEKRKVSIVKENGEWKVDSVELPVE